jgi:hypothetical protein
MLLFIALFKFVIICLLASLNLRVVLLIPGTAACKCAGSWSGSAVDWFVQTLIGFVVTLVVASIGIIITPATYLGCSGDWKTIFFVLSIGLLVNGLVSRWYADQDAKYAKDICQGDAESLGSGWGYMGIAIGATGVFASLFLVFLW